MKQILIPFFILAIATQVSAGEEIDVFADGRPWKFFGGTEFPPGGFGSFEVEEVEGKQTGVLQYDFSQGGVYVTGIRGLEVKKGPDELRFKVKSENPATVGIRLVDQTGQAHQNVFEYTEAGEWQVFRLDLNERAGITFGGANDKEIHFPLKEIRLFVQKKSGQEVGKVWFQDLTFR